MNYELCIVNYELLYTPYGYAVKYVDITIFCMFLLIIQKYNHKSLDKFRLQSI